MTSKAFVGKCLVDGTTVGEALVSARAFTFAHGVDPSTGKVTDVHSDIRGSNVKGRVLFYPFGKGSTTASSWFLEAVRLGNFPAAIVTEGVDLSAVIGSVMAGLVYGRIIPIMAGFPRGLPPVKTGDRVKVDAGAGEVSILT